MTKILIIVSTLKDLVRYAGGTAARFSQEGNDVYAVAVHESESAASQKACDALGLKSCEYFGLPGPLRTDPELADRLASVYREIRPDRILTYSKHNDHSRPSRSAVRDYAMTAYQTASGAGYRDGRPVSPRQTPFFGFICSNEKPDLYLSIDSGFNSKKQAAIIEGISEEEILADAVMTAAECRKARTVPCHYAESFTAFGAAARTGRFIW